jgi:sugar lactone lactonase YvrE
MLRVIAGVLALAAALGSAALAATLLAQAEPSLTPEWNLTTGFAAPESAYYDAASNAVFVSSINGQILEKDGNGYISRLSPDGKMVAEKWAAGVHAPKGLRSARGVLYAADIDAVVGFDITSGKEVSRVTVNGAQFLNDLATAPDGTVYVSDSAALKIFEVRGSTSSVFVEGAEVVEQPNGLLVDGGRLILGTIGPAPVPGAARGGGARGPAPSGHLYAFDRASKQRTLVTTQPVGGIDGIELDGSGGLLVTDVIGQRLLRVGRTGEVTVLAKFTAGGADFGYIAARKLAVVPFLFSNSVAAYDLGASLK